MHAIAETETGVRMIMLCGVISDGEAGAVQTALIDAVWRRGPGEVIVEVGASVTMDDTLLGALVAACAVAADCGTSLRIRCQVPEIWQRLAVAGCALAG